MASDRDGVETQAWAEAELLVSSTSWAMVVAASWRAEGEEAGSTLGLGMSWCWHLLSGLSWEDLGLRAWYWEGLGFG